MTDKGSSPMKAPRFASRRLPIANPLGHKLTLLAAVTMVFVFLCVSPEQAHTAEIATQTIAVGQALRGHFVQDRQLAGFMRPLRSEGSFVLVPGTGLIWSGQKPFSNVTVITSNGILQLANGQVAMRLQASRIPGLSHLYEVLGAAVSGDIEPLRRTFTVMQSGSPAQWRLVLTPLHSENPAMAQLKSLTLTGGRFVDAIEIDKGGGDVDRITFLDQRAEASHLTADEKELFESSRK
jgi:hypothetical protein